MRTPNDPAARRPGRTAIAVAAVCATALLLQPVPESGERPKPAEPIDLAMDDSYEVANEVSLGGFALTMVLDQDTENYHRQRAGIKAAQQTGARPAAVLANYQESRIRRLHMTVDEYMAG